MFFRYLSLDPCQLITYLFFLYTFHFFFEFKLCLQQISLWLKIFNIFITKFQIKVLIR